MKLSEIITAMKAGVSASGRPIEGKFTVLADYGAGGIAVFATDERAENVVRQLENFLASMKKSKMNDTESIELDNKTS